MGKLALFVSSYRVTISELRCKGYLNPAERPFQAQDRIVRKPVYFTSAEADREKVMEEIEFYAAKGLYDDGILASPTLPLVLFMALGLALGLFADAVLYIAWQLIARRGEKATNALCGLVLMN